MRPDPPPSCSPPSSSCGWTLVFCTTCFCGIYFHMQLQFLYLSPTIDHFSFLVNMPLMYRFFACLPPVVCSLPSATWLLLFADLKVSEASTSPIAPVDHNQRTQNMQDGSFAMRSSIDTKQTESHAPVHWRLGNISLYLACSW